MMLQDGGESPLFKRVFHGSFKVISGLGIGVLVAVLLVAWRLASGPVSIGFLTPYMQNALSDANQGAFDIRVEDTILTWAGWERTLDIRIINVETRLPSGDLVASIPEVSISLSISALIKGVIAPRSIELFGPRLKVQRDQNGHFAFALDGSEKGSDDFVKSMLFVMLQSPSPDRPMSYLDRISVVAGEITYEDLALDNTWFSPSANARFVRVDKGLKAELDLDLQIGDQVSAVKVSGDYIKAGQRMDLGVSFSDITPAAFAGVSEKMKMLRALDLPLTGTLTMSIQQNGQVEGFGFDLSGGAGHLSLPVALASDLGALAWAQRIGVENINLAGRYQGTNRVLDVTAFNLQTAPGESLYLPAPIDDDLPFDTLKAQFSYAGVTQKLDITELIIGFGKQYGNAEASVFGTVVKQQDASMNVDLTGVAQNVRFDDLSVLWPNSLGIDARTWVLESLSKGVADQASVDVSLRIDALGSVTLKNLAGGMQAHGVDVQYISTMPKVTNAKGHATFDDQRFDIVVDSGESTGGLKITSGNIGLVKLQEDMQWAEIDLNIEGSVSEALALIDSKPLGFASDLGIKPETAEGQAVAKVSLKIPLKIDLLAKEVNATASARLTGAGIKGVVFDQDLSKAALDLVVDNNGLSVQGKANLGAVPVQIKWNHDFRANALFVDRYQITGYIENVLNLGAMGVDVPEILARYMQGGAEVNVNYTELNNGRQSVSARIDLANIVLAAPELGWGKPNGVPGTAVLELRLDHGRPSEIPKFSVSAPDMDIAGSASFLKNGDLERINFDTMKSSLTDVSGSLTPTDMGVWEAVLRGESLDVSLLWDEMLGRREAENDATSGAETSDKEKLMINAALDIRSLVIGKGLVLHDLIGTVYRDHGLLQKIDISGVAGDTGTVELMLDTAVDGLRYLSIASNDAGATLRTLGLYDNILGGTFDLKAAYTRPGNGAPLEGVVKMKDYAMIKSPTFAKLIGVMSLTGIVDALQGDGLNFSILDAPFKLEKGVLELTKARASGPTIGVTASGTIDMSAQAIDLEGTVVPAYAINALLGKIPLIGKLFTGDENGGGLFAATYTMQGQGENVDINVNPLSILAPGVLQNIFAESKKNKNKKTSAQPKPSKP